MDMSKFLPGITKLLEQNLERTIKAQRRTIRDAREDIRDAQEKITEAKALMAFFKKAAAEALAVPKLPKTYIDGDGKRRRWPRTFRATGPSFTIPAKTS